MAQKKNLGVIYRKNLLVFPSTTSAPPGRARVNFLKEISLLGRFGGGSGSFSSLRPSFEGDD